MKQPPGYETEGKEHYSCELRKSIYGLKQAAKTWNDTLHKILATHEFEQSNADPCLYVKGKADKKLYLVVYVDDMIVAGTSTEHIDKLTKTLDVHFRITDMGFLKHFLGIQARRDGEGNFYISQSNYINKILNTYGLEESKGSTTPMDTGYFKTRGDSPTIENDAYRKLIGSLLYVAVNIRPDISASVAILSRHIAAPTKVDWNETKRVARYLKSTVEYELKLSSTNHVECELKGFADANWAEDRKDRKSNTGYVFKLFGRTISWACRKQRCVALSSTEAEFVALAETCQQAVWIRRMLESLGKHQKGPTTIYEDNQSCLNQLKIGGYSNRTKHIDTKYHYVKDLKEAEMVKFEYCSTEVNEADLFTKPIGATRMKMLCERIGLKRWDYVPLKENI